MRWGKSSDRLPCGRTAPVHPVVITHRRSAQGPLPKSRTTEQSHDTSVAHTRQVTVTRIICGVDIASSSLEARLGRQGALTSFANNAEGIAALAAFCHAHQVELVAMEATGGYEQQAFAGLCEQALPVAILNPRAVRRFAESMGRLEKADAIDAGMIAWYAEVKQSPPLCVAPASQQHLRALVTRLRQLTEIRTAQLIQRRLITDPAVEASFAELLAVLATQIDALQQNIAKLIDADPLWRELDHAFRSIKGVADRHSWPGSWPRCSEIGALSNKTILRQAGRHGAAWPATAASIRAGAASAEAERRYAKSCSSWPAWWAATNPTSSPSASASPPPESPPKSSASLSRTSCSCDSTPKPDKSANESPKHHAQAQEHLP